jgi:hypothetical protein
MTADGGKPFFAPFKWALYYTDPPYQLDSGASFLGQSVNLTTHFHQTQRIRMPLTPPIRFHGMSLKHCE